MSDGGQVVPFRRRQPAAGQERAGDRDAPEPDRRVSGPTRRAPQPARDLAVTQNREHWGSYQEALSEQEAQRIIAAGPPVPARISIALNLGGHEGPEVDLAVGTSEGNPAGDVDDWEAARAVPTTEQVELLSALTGFPPSWFHRPLPPGPLVGGGGQAFMCGPGGCTVVQPPWVDERGVLHYPDDPDDEARKAVRKPAQPALLDVEPATAAPKPPAAPAAGPAVGPVAAKPTPREAAHAAAAAAAGRKVVATPRQQQLAIPTGRLPEAERKQLDERLAEARKNVRRRR
jgi:hypothetical protein